MDIEKTLTPFIMYCSGRHKKEESTIFITKLHCTCLGSLALCVVNSWTRGHSDWDGYRVDMRIWYSAVHPQQAVRRNRRISVVDNWMAAIGLRWIRTLKSEVIWVGSRHTVHDAWSASYTDWKALSVWLTRHVYSVCRFLQTWRLTSMWRQSAASASTSCVNSAALSVIR